jgi:hypothetical protein
MIITSNLNEESVDGFPSMDTLLLITSVSNPDPVLVKGWTNAAAELGLHLQVHTDIQFLSFESVDGDGLKKYRGIILPDQIHKQMTPELVQKVKTYVLGGGQLMLVWDAGTKASDGHFHSDGSVFSDLIGVAYAARIQGAVPTQLGPIGHSKNVLISLGIPPGKFAAQDQDANAFCAISSYGYGALTYEYFMTKLIDAVSPEDNSLLLTTADRQFIAGVKQCGQGRVLFVNLPITFLWVRTDALLMHTFLHYFASEMLQLPTLSPVPDGVGGLIMNLHVESIDALQSLSTLESIGLFEQGPYSIDVTAGPDLAKVNDHMGMDVLHNETTRKWLHRFVQLGHTIGSDGGWLHDYYGINVSESNQNEFQKYLEMNNEAMEKVLGQKVREYVPSMGNQPHWATRYLERQGFVGYYTTSNTGTAPTQNFRDGIFDDPRIWSFPILPFGKYACLRDFGFADLPEQDVTEWLEESTEFVSTRHCSRLIYYHPTDISFFSRYLKSIAAWLATSKTLTIAGTFRWYTMVNLAEFLNSRREVKWRLEKTNNLHFIKADHPVTLNHQSWLLRKDRYSQPQIALGQGSVRADETHWIVTAGDGFDIQFTFLEIPHQKLNG